MRSAEEVRRDQRCGDLERGLLRSDSESVFVLVGLFTSVRLPGRPVAPAEEVPAPGADAAAPARGP